MTSTTWSELAARLAPSRNYWLGTTGRDGAPHAAPVWGVVVDERVVFPTEPATAKARNMAVEPRVVLHLESGDDVVIVRGTAAVLTGDDAIAAARAAFARKYTEPGDLEYLPTESTADVLYVLSPTSALSWHLDAYDDSQRRWTP